MTIQGSNENPILLSIAYLPNTQYFTKLLSGKALIEKHEHYQKQSYRNRCHILGANGPLTLIIPVKRLHGSKTLITEIAIDNDTNWQHMHWHSIFSAYKNSPYFDFYEEEFYPFYHQKFSWLFEYNHLLLDKLIGLTGINLEVSFTDFYHPGGNEFDFRDRISEKPRLRRNDTSFCPCSYLQVFSERFGFIPNLSVIDLLFSCGPDAINILQQSIKAESGTC